MGGTHLATQVEKLRFGKGLQLARDLSYPVYLRTPAVPFPSPTPAPSARGHLGRPHPVCPLTWPREGEAEFPEPRRSAVCASHAHQRTTALTGRNYSSHFMGKQTGSCPLSLVS